MPNGDSLLVFEGKLHTDDEVDRVLAEHGCKPRFGVADSGDDTEHVYQFCYKRGINCIKGGKQDLWQHADGSSRIFSEERPLAGMMPQGTPLKYETGDGLLHIDEPVFILYSKANIRNRLAWIRSAQSGLTWEVPEDVSDDYHKHMDAEELQATTGRHGESVSQWVQVKERNDLFVCECYIALLMEWAGIIGQGGK